MVSIFKTKKTTLYFDVIDIDLFIQSFIMEKLENPILSIMNKMQKNINLKNVY